MSTTSAPLTMKLRKVTDAQSGLHAYTYLAPDGWDINEQVIWDRHNMYNPAHLYAHCYNNDGFTVQLQAGYTNRYWAMPFGNSGNYPPRDITEALKIYLPWLRGVQVQFTEATILSSKQYPGAQGYNMNSGIVQEYGRIRGNYVKDGIRFDEILYGSMTMTYLNQPPDYMGFFYEDVTWDIDNLFLSCASGQRNPEDGVATAFAIKSSVQQTQEFVNYEQQTINQLKQYYNSQRRQASSSSGTANTSSAGSTPTKDAYTIQKETNEYINNLREDTRRKQAVAFDNQVEQFRDYINDVDRYTDSKGTEYTLPTGYGNTYLSSQGTVLMYDKNSPDYTPIDTSYEKWTRLGRKKY